ncbi:MAG: nitrogenase-stabilizing/protective protein NifW [Halochromatium sp.]
MTDLDTPLPLEAMTQTRLETGADTGIDTRADTGADTGARALPDSLDAFECDLDELETAEDFLDYFGVAFVPTIVQVNRLHILQRFHDYLGEIDEPPDSAAARYRLYADLLQGAYQDFVGSDARTEKVFRVFKMHEPRQVSVGLDQLLASRHAPTSLMEQPR